MEIKQDQYYIVVTTRAGIHFCQLKEEHNGRATLINTRRIRRWSGAASVSQLAMEGIDKECEELCEITMIVPEMVVRGVVEIIPCTEEASKNLQEVHVWKA